MILINRRLRHALPQTSIAFAALVGLAACGDSPKTDASAETIVSTTAAATAATPIAVTAAGASFTNNLTAAAPAQTGGFKRVAVVDEGLGAPMTSLTVEVPDAWMPYGGVQWNRGTTCFTNQRQVQWGAGSADRSHAVELLPGFGWQVQGWAIQMNPCPVVPFASIRDFLRAVVGQRYPNATVVDYRERADLVAEADAAKSAAPPNPQADARSFNEAAEVTLDFMVDGRAIRQSVAALATFTELGASRMGLVNGVLVVRAPKDEFDAALGERIRKSIKTDPQWAEQYIAYGKNYIAQAGAAQSADISRWHNQRMAEINAKGAADRAAIRSDTAHEVNAINAAGYQARQDSQDRMHRNNVDTIREVQRYQDPSSNRQVELSSHYNYGWKNSNGTFVANDDPNFNPGAGGQQMQRAP